MFRLFFSPTAKASCIEFRPKRLHSKSLTKRNTTLTTLSRSMLWRILKIMISELFTPNRIGLRMTNSTLDFRIWKLRTLSDEKFHVVSIASVEVASDLFTVLPLKRYIFKLTKVELRDNQGVRYNLQAKKHFYQPLLCRGNFTKQRFSMRGYTYLQRGFIPKTGTKN